MDWRQAAFAGLVGQDFRLDLGTRGKLALKLVQVQAGIAKIQAGRTRLVGATAGESPRGHTASAAADPRGPK